MHLVTKKSMSLDDELNVPIANLDLEEWFDSINSDETNPVRPEMNKKSNLTDSISLCNSLEDLVKTFDKNVKDCLINYKDIDIGQLAPVQVRSQEEILNDSQIWYTLTGNFGNLLPIDYDCWTSNRSLVRKYHDDSLNLKKPIKKKFKNQRFDFFEHKDDDDLLGHLSEEAAVSEYSFNSNSDEWLFEKSCRYETNSDENDFDDEEIDEEIDGYDERLDNDDDELRDQLDMHSMILAKSVYHDDDYNNENDDSLITAEQVLSEIETLMTLQDEEENNNNNNNTNCCYDELTPDSGCFSIKSGLNQNRSFYSTINSPSSTTNYKEGGEEEEFPIDLDGSYLKYINTFAIQNNIQNENVLNEANNNNNLILVDSSNLIINSNKIVIPCKKNLTNLNTYELNDLIEQIELSTKELSDILVHELDVKDELEFEKETKNTFISLLMSIQEKKRLLLMCSSEHISSSGSSSTSRHFGLNISNSLKKKNRRSMSHLDSINSTHLTTVIPYNSEIKYTVQHYQILNKLLKAINEQSQQVPELLTNYILKVVCPT